MCYTTLDYVHLIRCTDRVYSIFRKGKIKAPHLYPTCYYRYVVIPYSFEITSFLFLNLRFARQKKRHQKFINAIGMSGIWNKSLSKIVSGWLVLSKQCSLFLHNVEVVGTWVSARRQQQGNECCAMCKIRTNIKINSNIFGHTSRITKEKERQRSTEQSIGINPDLI